MKGGWVECRRVVADIACASILHHVIIVLSLVCFLSSYFACSHPLVYFFSFLYLYLVNERYKLRLRKKIQFEERKNANQSKLSDLESVRWLNHAIAKVWPICMERIASQQFLLPIIPWFLDKYKPWTASQAVVQNLYLGKNPPLFNKIRVLAQSADDDHLVLELGMNFVSGDDMSVILAVNLRKRLGFGIWAKMHVTGMHVEGKVLIGMKFLQQWPFLGRVRMSFVEPPYFQLTVKPIFHHGLDVTEFPGIAGWLDKILSIAFQQTLVEPNMLVVDVDKFVSKSSENWFTVNEKFPIAIAKVEIIEGADMKPSDMNGLADPYVKGRLGNYRFRTKIQWKTLSPKWFEEFRVPIRSWDDPNILELEVRDKDRIFDDILGKCQVDVGELRYVKSYDKWLHLENAKMGRLHLLITILEGDDRKVENSNEEGDSEKMTDTAPTNENSDCNYNLSETTVHEQNSNMMDEFEPINIEGQDKIGLWVHHPGEDVSETWEPRKGKVRHTDSNNVQVEGIPSPALAASVPQNSDTSSSEENQEGTKARGLSRIKKRLKRFGLVLLRNTKNGNAMDSGDNSSPPMPARNLRAVGDKAVNIRFVMDESHPGYSVTGQEGSSPVEVDRQGNDQVKSPGSAIANGFNNLKSVLSKKGSFNKRKGGEKGTAKDAERLTHVSEDSSNEGEEESQTPVHLIVKGVLISNPVCPSTAHENSGSPDEASSIQQIADAISPTLDGSYACVADSLDSVWNVSRKVSPKDADQNISKEEETSGSQSTKSSMENSPKQAVEREL